MTLPVRLREAKTGILDAAGDGTIILGPVPTGSRWTVQRLRISITGGQAGNVGAVCRVYEDVIDETRLVDASGNAGADLSELAQPIEMAPGGNLFFVFGGGTALARAQASLEGIRI